MAITTMAQLQAAVSQELLFNMQPANVEAAGVMWNPHWNSGQTIIPRTATFAASGAAGTALSSGSGANEAGFFPFPPNDAGEKIYLAGLQGTCRGQRGTIMLIDRLWHTQDTAIAVTTTTEQAINSVAFPARDLDGATAGRGVFLALEVEAADTTNAGAVTNCTARYTNSGGTGTRTARIRSFPATCRRSAFIPFDLDDDDLGVQSVQGITLGTSLGAGNVSLVAYRILALLPINNQADIERNDALTIGLPALASGTCLNIVFMPNSTTGVRIVGTVTLAHG